MRKSIVRAFTFFICIIASLGGLLFGIDQGFINGSLELIRKGMHLSLTQSEQFASILMYGCIVGTIISGWFSKTFGRKQTLLLAALFFSIFSIAGALTHNVTVLFATRFFLGLAVGFSSFVVPLYLSEIAPMKIRGAFIAMYQLMITIGILAIYISNHVIDEKYHSWRPMMGVIAVPAFVLFICVLFIPKTPRWLSIKGKFQQAEKVLNKIIKLERKAKIIMNEIRSNVEKGESKALWQELTKPYFISVALVGVLLFFLQQFSGINIIIYYSTNIFQNAGMHAPAVGTVLVGCVFVFSSIISIRYLDKWGRKPIIYFGLSVMLATLIIIGYLFHLKTTGTVLNRFEQQILLIAVLVYIFAFGVSLGPIPYIICAEIFPIKIRDFGITITTLSNWVGTLLVARYSLTIGETFGNATLFSLCAVSCILGFIFVKFFVPETKGISLEHIETNLLAGKKMRHIGT